MKFFLTSLYFLLVLGATCFLLALAVYPRAGTRDPGQLVDALNGDFGKQQPGVRAVHAQGVDLLQEYSGPLKMRQP